MTDPNTIKIIAATVVAEGVSALYRGLSTKEKKLMSDEEKTQKWKNKMRKFDRI